MEFLLQSSRARAPVSSAFAGHSGRANAFATLFAACLCAACSNSDDPALTSTGNGATGGTTAGTTTGGTTTGGNTTGGSTGGATTGGNTTGGTTTGTTTGGTTTGGTTTGGTTGGTTTGGNTTGGTTTGTTTGGSTTGNTTGSTTGGTTTGGTTGTTTGGVTTGGTSGGATGTATGEVVTLPGGIPVVIGAAAPPTGTQIAATVLREYEVPAIQPESLFYDPATAAFYGGSTVGGAVYRARIDGMVETFMQPGFDGSGALDPLRLATQGFYVAGDRLYIAGGPNGILSVYRLPEGARIGSFPTLPGAYLNDMAVAPNGDVYVTDSLLPFLYRFTAAQIERGTGVPQLIALSPEFAYVDKTTDTNPLEANGIRVTPDGRYVLIDSLNDHALYRLGALTSDPATTPLVTGADRQIVKLAIEGDLGDADGMTLLDATTLYVMDNNGEAVSRVELTADYTRGRIVSQARSERFHTPSGVTLAPDDTLLITNAELFDLSEPGSPFFVTRIPRF